LGTAGMQNAETVAGHDVEKEEVEEEDRHRRRNVSRSLMIRLTVRILEVIHHVHAPPGRRQSLTTFDLANILIRRMD